MVAVSPPPKPPIVSKRWCRCGRGDFHDGTVGDREAGQGLARGESEFTAVHFRRTGVGVGVGECGGACGDMHAEGTAAVAEHAADLDRAGTSEGHDLRASIPRPGACARWAVDWAVPSSTLLPVPPNGPLVAPLVLLPVVSVPRETIVGIARPLVACPAMTFAPESVSEPAPSFTKAMFVPPVRLPE